MQKICKHHGLTEHASHPRSRGGIYWKCKKCNVEAVVRRRKKVRVDLIAYKGGKCERCGYNKCSAALELHHKDPSQKEFSLSAGGITRNWEKAKKEADKCLLLCANCHREEHYSIDNGG